MICFIITRNQTVLCAIQVVFSAIYLYFTMYSIYSDFIFWHFSTSKPHRHNIGHKNRKKGTRCPRGFPQFIVCSNSSFHYLEGSKETVRGNDRRLRISSFGRNGCHLLHCALDPRAGRKIHKKQQAISSLLLCLAFAADIVCCIIFGFNTGAGVGGKL